MYYFFIGSSFQVLDADLFVNSLLVSLKVTTSASHDFCN